MQSTGTKQAREKSTDSVAAAALSTAAGSSQHQQTIAGVAMDHRIIGYGLPCANCRAYYPSDMETCPICKSHQRVAPAATPSLPSAASSRDDAAKMLNEERERLREIKSKIYAPHPAVPAATFRCALDQNHTGDVEPAAVCHSCYGDIRQ